MKKILLILGIALVVLIIAVAVVVGLYLGPIVKIGMEQVGPKITQVSIKVDAVDMSVLTGSATVKGLVVGNPQGYTTPQAISVGTIAVSMDPFSVTSHKIVVHSIHVEAPEITFEGGLGSNNLNKILSNVTSFQNSISGSPNTSSQNNSKPVPNIEVDDFLITGAKVHVNIQGLGTKDLTLPDIHLNDLGKGNDGLTPAEFTGAILNAISSDTLKAVASSVGDLKNLGTGTIKSVSNSVSRITSSFGGLFGK